LLVVSGQWSVVSGQFQLTACQSYSSASKEWHLRFILPTIPRSR